MAAVTVFTKSGSKSQKTVTLPKAVFEVEIKNTVLLAQAYRAYLANGRAPRAQTLKRGEVRGGGKKPWRQKGTGRARVGSIRSPIWRGGGITFGPTGNENYTIKLPLKAKRLAIRQALSAKAKDGAIKIIEGMSFAEGKVKPMVELMKKIGVSRNVLLVVNNKDDLVERSTGNIASLKVVQAQYLNVFDIINADHIMVDEPALKVIDTWLGSKDDSKTAKAPATPAKKAVSNE